MGLRTIIRLALLRHGICIAPLANRSQIEELIESLKPVETGLVRIGTKGDGGYLVPDDLDGIVACFSPGVARAASFEIELASKGLPCFLADFSVEGPPISHPLFHFQKKYLGSINNDRFMTLESWVNGSGCGEGDLMLQMDIEGAEYDAILSSPSHLLQRFRTIVIEFHRFDMIYNKAGNQLIRLTMEKLLRDFVVVHIHPNNCRKLSIMQGIQVPPVVEFTFHRRDRLTDLTPVKRLPHPLDTKNVSNRPDIAMPKCWFG